MHDNSAALYVDVDGELLPAAARHVSALDRGFTLGDGVFETIRVAHGTPFRLAAHLARLRASTAVLEFAVPRDDDALAAGIDRLLATNGLREAVVRVTVSRGIPAERGLLPPPEPQPTVVIQAVPFRELPPEKVARGFAVRTSAVRRNEYSPTSRIKSCNYLDNVLARVEARRAGADEAVLLNTAGALACCSAANLHLVQDGRVLTPALDCGALAGITRQAVRDLAARLGLAWAEAWLRPNDLSAAREAFLTSSVLGVVPITAVDTFPVGIGKPGPLTLRLRREYVALVGDGS